MEKSGIHIKGYASYVNDFIMQFGEIGNDDLGRLLPLIELRTFAKRQVVLPAGETENYLNLVLTGMARKYVVAGRNEVTLQLATEGHVIHSEISFHKRVPSPVAVETLESTQLLSMTYDNVQKALAEIPVAEKIGRAMMSYRFIKKDERYFALISHSTRQRFLRYLEHHPQMLQRVPQKILASYLNIKPETFSRLKHLLHQK